MATTKIRIEASKIGEYRKAVEKLNKKIQKYGNGRLEVMDAKLGESISRDDDGKATYIYRFMDVTLNVETIRVSGWNISGYFERHDDDIVTLKSFDSSAARIDGKDIDFRHCAHCNTRHLRKKLAYLTNGEGNEAFIGFGCLKDYIGITPSIIESMLAGISKLTDQDEVDGSYRGNSPVPVFKLEEVIAYAKILVDHRGTYYPSDSPLSTGYEVLVRFQHYGSEVWEDSEYFIRGTDDAIQWAKNAIEYTKNIIADNDYLYNIKAIAEKEYVDFSNIKRAASIAAFYGKYLKNKARQDELKNSNSEHVGNIKDRLTLDLKVRSSRIIEGYYGTSILFIFSDEDGNMFKWFSTSNPDIERENTYSITGTVKEHEEYQGVKYTLLSRCRVN